MTDPGNSLLSHISPPDLHSAQLRIDVADEAALPACFALLPKLALPSVLVFTARDPDGTLAGAAGVNWQSWNDPPGFPGWIHVLPDRRRRGIGRALAHTLKDAIRGETMHAIWAMEPLDSGSAAARFAAACGFERVRSQLFFDADATSFLQMIEDVVARLRARNRVPANARLVEIDAVAPAEIARLVFEGIRSAPPRIMELLRSSRTADPATAPIDRDRSFVLVVDGELAGALLSKRQADRVNSTIICNVVDPRFRGGWANALLLQATTRRGVLDGCLRFSFDCADHVRDTIGLAKRCGADRVRTAELYRYAARAIAPL